MRIPTTTAIALPTNLPAPAKLEEASFPEPMTGSENVNPSDPDFGSGEVAIFAPGARKYDILVGNSGMYATFAAGKDFDAAVSAASALSAGKLGDVYEPRDDNSAIGVFQAKDGAYYLSDFFWNSDGNDDGHNLGMDVGDRVRRGVDQLQAVVSDVAFADLRTTPVVT